MDELFDAAGFAQIDLDLKARMEREIGLTAVLVEENRRGDIVGNEKLIGAIVKRLVIALVPPPHPSERDEQLQA